MVIVVVIVSSSVVFCVVVDSFCFGAVWILSTRRLSVVRVVFHCCGFFPLQSRVDSFHSAAHRCPAVIVLSVSHYVAHWPCFIKGRAAGFWCGDSGVVHAGASQPGVGCTLLYGPRLLLARLLNLLSLRRNTEKLMMAADTPRNSSKTTTAVRGSGAGRKLHPVRRLADMRKTLVLLSLELHLHPGRPQVLLQSVMRVRSTTLFSLWIQAKDNDDDDRWISSLHEVVDTVVIVIITVLDVLVFVVVVVVVVVIILVVIVLVSPPSSPTLTSSSPPSSSSASSSSSSSSSFASP